MRHLSLLCILFLLVGPGAALELDGKGKLRIGRVAYTAPEKILISHNPLALHLKQQLGIEDVEFVLFVSYGDIHNRLMAGELDLGWLGTAYFGSREEQNYEPLVRPNWNGRLSYRGQIFTRSDSTVEKVEDLEGMKVAFVSEHSSSGYIFPQSLMRKAGLELEDLEGHSFLDKHNAVAYAVFTRQFDAGASYYGLFQDGGDIRDHLHKSHFRIIAVTEEISNEPLVIRKVFSREVKEKVSLAFQSAASSGVLSSIKGLMGFHEAANEDYQNARDLLNP